MSKRSVIFGTAVTGALALGVLIHPEAAQAVTIVDLPADPAEIGKDDVIKTLMNIIQLGLMFAAAIGAIFIVINAYQYIFSAGNPDKIEKAKMGLTWSVGGFILAISSFAIVFLLAQTLKFDQLTFLKNRQPNSVPGSTEPILQSIANMLFVFGGAVAVAFIILGGYRYITSMGNQDSIEKAKKTLLYAIVGLILIFASATIFNFIANRLHVT